MQQQPSNSSKQEDHPLAQNLNQFASEQIGRGNPRREPLFMQFAKALGPEENIIPPMRQQQQLQQTTNSTATIAGGGSPQYNFYPRAAGHLLVDSQLNSPSAVTNDDEVTNRSSSAPPRMSFDQQEYNHHHQNFGAVQNGEDQDAQPIMAAMHRGNNLNSNHHQQMQYFEAGENKQNSNSEVQKSGIKNTAINQTLGSNTMHQQQHQHQVNMHDQSHYNLQSKDSVSMVYPVQQSQMSYQRQFLNGFMDIRLQEEYHEFYHSSQHQQQLLPPITAENEQELGQQLKQQASKHQPQQPLQPAPPLHQPQINPQPKAPPQPLNGSNSAMFGHMGLGFSHLSSDQEGRRRQSSNFFDILTDPQAYKDQVQQFMSEQTNEFDSYDQNLQLQDDPGVVKRGSRVNSKFWMDSIGKDRADSSQFGNQLQPNKQDSYDKHQQQLMGSLAGQSLSAVQYAQAQFIQNSRLEPVKEQQIDARDLYPNSKNQLSDQNYTNNDDRIFSTASLSAALQAPSSSTSGQPGSLQVQQPIDQTDVNSGQQQQVPSRKSSDESQGQKSDQSNGSKSKRNRQNNSFVQKVFSGNGTYQQIEHQKSKKSKINVKQTPNGAASTISQNDQTPTQTVSLTVPQIAAQYGLVSTFETLEGSEKLSHDQIIDLVNKHTLALTSDQGGCRFLQSLICNRSSDQDDKILMIVFERTLDHFEHLMKDPFGNYLAQKMLEVLASPEDASNQSDPCDTCPHDVHIMSIIQTLSKSSASQIFDLCIDMHGTRSMQKLIEISSAKRLQPQRELIQILLRPQIHTLSHEINGNHVLFKLLTSWQAHARDKQFIYDQMVQKCDKIACHKHGCCIMQKCIDAGDREQKRELNLAIAKHTKKFVRDPFANYVVQFILELKNPEICHEVGSQLLGSLLQLSLEKFSSNVIEKCLERTTDQIRYQMVKEISQAPPTVSYFSYLVDQYSNYVIQKSLQVAVEPLFSQFLERLKPDMPRLSQAGDFGFKIYTRLAKQYPQLQVQSAQRPSQSINMQWPQSSMQNQQSSQFSYQNNPQNYNNQKGAPQNNKNQNNRAGQGNKQNNKKNYQTKNNKPQQSTRPKPNQGQKLQNDNFAQAQTTNSNVVPNNVHINIQINSPVDAASLNQMFNFQRQQ